MVKFAAGDYAVWAGNGNQVYINSVSSPNANVQFSNVTNPTAFTAALADLRYDGPTDGLDPVTRKMNVRTHSAADVTPVLQYNDGLVIFTNVTTTGFTTRTLPAGNAGQQLRVKNATGTTFNTGDFSVVNAHIWTFTFDGANWIQNVVA